MISVWDAGVADRGTVQGAARQAPQPKKQASNCSGEDATAPSFSAFMEGNCLEWDLSIALALPLLLIMPFAKSIDPWVGRGPGRSPPRYLAPWAALPVFPRGDSIATQVLHIVRLLPSYALVMLPLSLVDWPSAVFNTQALAFPAVILLLTFSLIKTSRLWACWRRWRLFMGAATGLAACCLVLVPSFLLLPPHTRPTCSSYCYMVGASTSSLLSALLLGLLDPAFKVLLGLAMMAWPVGLSWAVERRLRRQHAALCWPWDRRRGRQVGKLEALHAAPVATAASQFDNAVAFQASRGQDKAPATATVPAALESTGTRLAVQPSSSTPAGPSALYRSAMSTTVVSLKVQEHPGSFQEFGGLASSVLYDSVREQLTTAARGSSVAAARAGGTVPQLQRKMAEATVPPLCSTVIRGCVQVVLWARVPEEEVFGTGGAGDAVQVEQLLQRLATELRQAVAQHEGAGGVRGVSVQVGQQVAVLGGPGETHMPGTAVGQEQLDRHGQEDMYGTRCSTSPAQVRLLQMSPPAASLGAASACGSMTLRLMLHSPVPQPARVLVLAEWQGASSNSAGPPAEPHGGSSASSARLLLELPVQLEGGVQELEVGLGAGQLAAAVMQVGAAAGVGSDGDRGVAADEADAAGMLRVMMVGPEHWSLAEPGEQEQGPAPARPLVHWIAPPLLLLPPAAAAEVCGAWEEMQREAAGGRLTETGMEGKSHQEQRQAADQKSQAEAGGAVLHAGAISPCGSSRLLASVERRSSLWWSHMAPLLGDLAHALGGHRGMGQEGYAGAGDAVAHTLLSYVQGRGMVATLSLLDQACTRHVPAGPGMYPAAATMIRSRSAPSLPPVHPDAATSDWASAPTAATQGSSHVQEPAVGGSHTSACTTTGSAAPGCHAVAVPGSLLLLLPRPFSPPHLEAAYQAWRLTGLAANAAYVLGFCSTVCFYVMMRTVMSWASRSSGGGAAGDSGAPRVFPWAQLAHAAATSGLNTVSHVLALAVLEVLVFVRSRAAQQRQGRQAKWRSAGSTLGLGADARGLVLQPSDVWVYRLTACIAGPGVQLACSILVLSGATPPNTHLVGSIRTIYALSLIRAVIVPCLQQMSTWEAVAAAPLLGLADAWKVRGVRPGWGVWGGAAVALLWRLVAVGVSAVWERRSRRRFVRMHQEDPSVESGGPSRTGGVRLGAKVKAA